MCDCQECRGSEQLVSLGRLGCELWELFVSDARAQVMHDVIAHWSERADQLF